MGNSVVNSENKSKEKKRTTITKEEVKEWAAPDEESLEYYDLGEFSTTLPVVYMNTKGQQVLKENAIWGNIALLDGNGEEQSVFSIPNSISLAVNLISLVEASIRMHSRIDIVVLEGTALDTILTPFSRFAFEQVNFMCITPFKKAK